jgi:hypothetical protein
MTNAEFWKYSLLEPFERAAQVSQVPACLISSGRSDSGIGGRTTVPRHSDGTERACGHDGPIRTKAKAAEILYHKL